MVKVLIADDSEEFRRLNAELLKLDGHVVITARNGRETLALVRAEKPDVLLLDIMMPGMDGYEVCRLVKSDPETKDTVVIMVTVLSESERFRSYQAGADEHISKPIPARQMRLVVQRVMERKRQGLLHHR